MQSELLSHVPQLMNEHIARFVRRLHVLHPTAFMPDIVDGGISGKLSTVANPNLFFVHAELSNSQPFHAVQFQKD
jgi:hypothetical protein